MTQTRQLNNEHRRPPSRSLELKQLTNTLANAGLHRDRSMLPALVEAALNTPDRGLLYTALNAQRYLRHYSRQALDTLTTGVGNRYRVAY